MLCQKEIDNGEVGEVRNASDEEKLTSNQQLDILIEKSFKEYDVLYKLLT